jgi:dethiobiotin synthetase
MQGGHDSGSTMNGIYITGTDTGVGKTLASAALLHALRTRGLRAVGMKPLASGCACTSGGWRNDDALALQDASDPRPDYDDINPYALPLPLAPELAAGAAGGVEIALDRILAAHARLAAQADMVVVEGVGGWMSPLSATLDQIDLVRALQLPVVLVVGLRLGCQNHALLSARAIAADGASLVGWIASEVDPGMACRDENVATLSRRLSAPCLGRLPYHVAPDPASMAQHLHVAPIVDHRY